jgi:hypothetical protein
MVLELVRMVAALFAPLNSSFQTLGQLMLTLSISRNQNVRHGSVGTPHS